MLESLTPHHRRPFGRLALLRQLHLMDYELMGGDARAAIIAEYRQARA